MGTECLEACPSGESAQSPSAPPGFSPLISFTLEKAQDQDTMGCVGFSSTTGSQGGFANDMFCEVTEDKLRKSLRHRPSINYSEADNSSEEESDSESIDHIVPSINILRKGVIRGCLNCANCQKVLARWQPNNSRRPLLDEAPVFYPSEEEFKDTMKYIESIRKEAEAYGICRIVPPSSWKPPCVLKKGNVWQSCKFATRVQRVDMLQNRPSLRQVSRFRNLSRKKRRRLLKGSAEHGNIEECCVETSYAAHNSENFGFELGPFFSLESFQKYADDFKIQYFRPEAGCHVELQKQFEPSVEDIEGEYWRIVEKPTEEIEVLYGADVITGDFGSGFPKASSASAPIESEDEYIKSGWNLNNFPQLPGSVLSFESGDISGVIVPWLYVGMCFSSFCWHVEDHHLYSLNYMHFGAPKMWYGVPGEDASKLEETMKNHLHELFEEQPDLLHKLVTQFSPSILKSEGVRVYRCIQNSGEFVLTFPRGYHSGFNCGFNCAEAVNVAPIDWLPHGQTAVELYRDQCRKITISHDKLLLGAARQAVKAQWEALFLKKTTSEGLLWKNVCGLDKVLAKALKARFEVERNWREQLCHASQCRKMDANFDASGDKECFICHYDLHLSATGCMCSADRFACFNHAKQLCSCDSSCRIFLFRYEINELNTLVDAVGGKLSAVHKWGISDLGLSLSSYVAKHKSCERSLSSQVSAEDKQLKQTGDLSSGASLLSQELYALKEKQVGNGPCKPIESSQEGGREDHVIDVKKDSLMFSSMVAIEEKGPSDLTTDAEAQKLSELSDIMAHKSSHEHESDNTIQKISHNVLNSARQLSSEIDLKFMDIANESGQPKVYGDIKKLGSQGAPQIISDSKNELTRFPEVFARIKAPDDIATTCDHQDQGTPETSASIMKEGDACLHNNVEQIGHVGSNSSIQERTKGTVLTENRLMLSDQQMPSASSQKNFQNMHAVGPNIMKRVRGPLTPNRVDILDNFNNRSKAQTSALPIVTTTDGNDPFDSLSRVMDRQSVTDNSSCPSSSVEGVNLQKGPRMAKVVRRFNCAPETLQFGTVLSGKLWSTSQIIFPKGYRSRVRYFSVKDPTQMCYYVSEILDGGSHGPLFMRLQESFWVAFSRNSHEERDALPVRVQVENCSNEVFIHFSATKCWDMVRERINYEIRRQHGIGKFNGPHLQPPGSVDGLEMFGLLSSSVILAIEALDPGRICSEYWKSRNSDPNLVALSSDRASSLGPGVTILKNLFKKVNSKELQILHLVLSDDRPSCRQELLDLINEQIQGLRKSSDFT